MSKVSVITTLYNYQEYIEECILSVMSQSYKDVEMIVVDDFSSDSGPSIVEGLQNRFNKLKLIKLNKNYGYSTAKNVGIKASEGEFISMLDADDMLLPDSIKKRVELIKNGYDIVHGYALNLIGNKRRENELRSGWKKHSSSSLSWKYIHPQSVILRKNIHEEIGLYDENLRCKSDREMWARIINRGYRVGYIDDPVCLYRLHGNQMHKSKWKIKNNKKLASELMSLVEIRKNDISDCIKMSQYEYKDKVNPKEKFSKEEALTLAKSSPQDLYDENFFQKRNNKLHEWNFGMGKYVTNKLGLKSVIDLGCGIGSFLSGVKSAGASEISGIEVGYENAKPFLVEDVSDKIKYGNLSIESDFGQFDAAVSVEVAEHLLPEHADVFVKNLCKSSSRMIIMTAARPGQPGMYHFNCQNPEYWIEKIKKQGFTYRDDLTKKISQGWKDNCPGIPSYLYTNVMVFKATDKCSNLSSNSNAVNKKKLNNTQSAVSVSFDLKDTEESGKHKFFQRMREDLVKLGYVIKSKDEPSDIHFYINNKNKNSKVNIKRLDGVYFDNGNLTKSRNRSIINSMNISDGIIYQSKYCRDMACRVLNYDYSRKKHSIIYNGCDPAEFNVEPIVLDKPYFLAMCKWRRHKRLFEAIQGFEYSGLEAKLIVAGPADAHSVNPNIIFVGDLNRKDLARYLKGCIATVHLAWIDWCPNSVVESLVAGKQVIHTNSGGTSEIVNGRGYMVEDTVWEGEVASPKNPPFLNPSAISEAMVKSIKNPISNFNIEDLLISKTTQEYINFGLSLLRNKR